MPKRSTSKKKTSSRAVPATRAKSNFAVDLDASHGQLSFALPGASRTALALPSGLEWNQWTRVGQTIMGVHTASQWWTGDWLNYGEASFGEKYAQVLDESKQSYEQIQRLARVSSRVDAKRRRVELSWSHHLEVAPLERAEQDQWLQKAIDKGWSAKQLREAIREAQGKTTTDDAGEAGSGKCCKCCEGGCQADGCRCSARAAVAADR